MESQVRAKVTGRLDYDRPRPTSPYKPPTSLSPPPSVTIRPKAKVNSSATIQSRKPGAAPSVLSATRSSATSTPRAPSPFKVAQSISAPGSSAFNPAKARLTARPNGGLSASASPVSESRQRSLTTISSDVSSASRGRPRRGSASSHHTPSPSHSELRPRAYSPAHSKTPSEENGSPTSSVGTSAVRIKSRLGGAGSPPPISISPSASPPLRSNRPARVPSMSGLSIPSPLLPTNVNSAPASATVPGHHRFATTRESHTHRTHPFQPFPSNDDLAVKYSGYSVSAKIDPAAIPLPPQSPPMSAISFSSRSSASRSSVSFQTQTTDASTAPTLGSRVNGHARVPTADRVSPPRSSLDAPASRQTPSPSDGDARVADDGAAEHDLDDLDDLDDDLDSEDPERKRKAAAKSIRKIADLEITTRSLLAINATLEATKHRQAKEIRDLRRKLRESRLILPPPAFRAVKSSLSHDDTAEDEDEDEDEDGEEDEEAQAAEAGRTDATYGRVKTMIEGLLTSCQQALATRPEDFDVGATGSAKVLSAEEVRSWRGDDTDTRSLQEPNKLDVRPSTPSRIAVPDSDDDGLESEDEVEVSLSAPSASLPPITVTPSP